MNLRASVILQLFACLIFTAGFVAAEGDGDLSATPDSRDTWNSIYLNGGKIGYEHASSQKIVEGNIPLVKTHKETVTSIVRFGHKVGLKTKEDIFETMDGIFIRYEGLSMSDKDEMRLKCKVAGHEMNWVLTSPAGQTSGSIPWDDETLGPYGQEQRIKKQKLTPGSVQTFKAFVADRRDAATFVLVTEGLEETRLLDGARKLHRVRMEMDSKPHSKIWLDDRGELLKSRMEVLSGLVAYRVNENTALMGRLSSADFGLANLIKLDRKIPQAAGCSKVVYRMKMEGDSLEKLIAQDDRQTFSRDEKGGMLLTVCAVEPGRENQTETPISTEYLRPGELTQAGGDEIQKLSSEIIGNETDLWKKAQRLENWVFQNGGRGSFLIPSANSKALAEMLQGDCVDHATLLKALARADGVPARGVVGLVYDDNGPGFLGHMWTEVYINGKWVPLDATRGQGRVGCDHIKIAALRPDGGDFLEAATHLMQLVNRLRIEVVSWEIRK